MTSDQQTPGRDGTGDASRLGVRSIKEVSSPRDEELAVIFREMRRASGVTQEQIAGRLATSVETVVALESGALGELPEWTEIKRIVTAYAAQLGLDSRPILRRMQGQLGVADGETASPKPQQQAAASKTAPPQPAGTDSQPSKQPAAPTGPPMPPSARAAAFAKPGAAPATPPSSPSPSTVPPNGSGAAQPAAPKQDARSGPAPKHRKDVPPQQEAAPIQQPAEPARPKRARRIAAAVLNWSLLIVFVTALGTGVWYAAQNPRKVWGAVDNLPDPLPRLMRAAWQMVRPLDKGSSGAPVTDPDKRRSDRLP